MSPPAVRPVAPSLSGARVLVTGGLGFIGSTVVHRLAASGADVTVVDALVPEHGGDRRNLDDLSPDSRVDVLVADIGDPAVADALVGTDVVLNVAGQMSHLASMQDPLRDLDLNVRAHVQFLEMVRAHAPTATVVLTSTRQVYGRPSYLPVDEDHPTIPVDVNGIDKLACERFHLLYGSRYDLRAVVLRLTNVYGPRQLLKHNRQGFIAWFIRRAIENETIQIYGDGSQRRDFVFVDDAADAFLRAGAADACNGEVFNVGGDAAISLGDLAALLLKVAGTGAVQYVDWPADKKAIDIGSFYADSTKFTRTTGWRPTTSLEDGLRRTIAFYRENLHHYVSAAQAAERL
jgi:UDP-glucose 4-epimerase